MNKEEVLKALKKAKEISPKRNFKQSIDLIINLRGLDLKKTENQLDLFITLHYGIGRKMKVCALVGPELLDQAKQVCDNTISVDDFPRYQGDKKLTKKLAKEFDFFIAQATIMPKVAASFGRVLGTRGKMPNPKAGCVVPPNANLKPLYEKLQKTVRIAVKTEQSFKCPIGKDDSNEEEVADNIISVYNAIVSHLPNEKQDIKDMIIKLSMGPVVKVGAEQEEEVKEKAKTKKAAKKEKKAIAAKEEKAEKKNE